MHPRKVIKRLSELPAMPFTIDTMKWNQTGDWRYLTPRIANRPAPCTMDCPAGIPIPDYLSAINHGDIQKGLALLLSHNPLPGLTGRLCYHPCQTKCLRKKIDGSIMIPEIERFMADLPVDTNKKQNRKTNKRVTMVGSGPLGLSCAFYLGCWGLQVTVLDRSDQAGGALVDLPSQKIESKVLENEINRLIRIADIQLETGSVFDFNRPTKSPAAADLIILDPTRRWKENESPAGAIAFDPSLDEEISGDIIAVTLTENLKSFKASRIAHYIAVGRSMAEKAFFYLNKKRRQNFDRQEPEEFSRAGNKKVDRSKALVTFSRSRGAETKQKGTREGERVLHESGRCLSCGTCNLCLQCASSCPDACIGLVNDQTAVAVDLDYCKGCGICAFECPRGVISMEEFSS